MNSFDALGLRNRRAIPLASVPRVEPAEFRETVVEAVRDGWRVVAFFGTPEPPGQVLLMTILAKDERGHLGAISTTVKERYRALTPDCQQVHLF